MTLSIETIIKQYPYVFNNEFNSRVILAHGHKLKSTYKEFSMGQTFDVTTILTKDKNGVVEQAEFWQDFTKNIWCYSFVNSGLNFNEKLN